VRTKRTSSWRIPVILLVLIDFSEIGSLGGTVGHIEGTLSSWRNDPRVVVSGCCLLATFILRVALFVFMSEVVPNLTKQKQLDLVLVPRYLLFGGDI